jgi:hypothetical protein
MALKTAITITTIAALVALVAIAGCDERREAHRQRPLPVVVPTASRASLLASSFREYERISLDIYSRHFVDLSLHRRHQIQNYVRCIEKSQNDPAAGECVSKYFK